MQVKIIDIDELNMKGVRVSHKERCSTYCEDYFECTTLGLKTDFQSKSIVMGMLEGWHHTPKFSVMETHADSETFYFYEGVALMPFCDVDENGKPDPKTGKIARIPAGTHLELAAGVHHFVAVAEKDHFACIVYCPEQSADRVFLSEPIEGIK